MLVRIRGKTVPRSEERIRTGTVAPVQTAARYHYPLETPVILGSGAWLSWGRGIHCIIVSQTHTDINTPGVSWAKTTDSVASFEEKTILDTIPAAFPPRTLGCDSARFHLVFGDESGSRCPAPGSFLENSLPRIMPSDAEALTAHGAARSSVPSITVRAGGSPAQPLAGAGVQS